MSVLRIANCSGFYGDRISAAREVVEGGPIDVLTGDWLAELTMYVLSKTRERGAGYARTFLTQLEQVLGTCVERGIKVVSNAGGLDPEGCAAAVRGLAGRLGLDVRVAVVTGDDVTARAGELPLPHLVTGQPLDPSRTLLTANAYLGGHGIAAALAAGADVVVCGRVTDASLVVGPAQWRFGWPADDWDRLASAVVVGHALECGAQVTGGNYAFFQDLPGMERAGFPVAELAEDGTAVITKHPGTGGAVTVGTVTAQLLYEIGGPTYLSPDAAARFDTIRLEQEAPDRVRVSGVRGLAPPPTLKVSAHLAGGFRSTLMLALPGLQAEEKAAMAEAALWAQVPGGRSAFREVRSEVLRGDEVSWLRLAVRGDDEAVVGRALSAALVSIGLASYPGLFGMGAPGSAQAVSDHWPATVDRGVVPPQVTVDGEPVPVEVPAGGPAPATDQPVDPGDPPPPAGPLVRVPLGVLLGARSGDKGGDANVGVWAETDAAWDWARRHLGVAALRRSLPELEGLAVDRYELPNLRALNFVVRGLLGEGVASGMSVDPQAKGLGERLRARPVEVPASLLDEELPARRLRELTGRVV